MSSTKHQKSHPRDIIFVSGSLLFLVHNGLSFVPSAFSLNINDIGCIAEGVEGVINGSSTIWVTHMLYADDFCQVPYCKKARTAKPCSIVWTSMPRGKG